MFFGRRSAFLLPLLLSKAYCTYQNYGCNVGTESADIDQAVDDVVTVAITALAALTTGKVNGKEDVFQSAYDPLFVNDDKGALIYLFAQISVIKTSPFRVTIYCTENHVKRHKNDPTSWWEDRDYYSKPNGKQMPIGIKRGTNKPSARGSYTTIGYKQDDEWDTSSYSHIYITEDRRRPPASTSRDLRRYPDIVKDGLDGRYTFIENIKPLAQTVMHELLHAVGGISELDPTTGKRPYKIIDGPNQDLYGWLKCNRRRDFGVSNANIADCITYLAQAIFLQIQGKDTYWSTGEVDLNTLGPKWV